MLSKNIVTMERLGVANAERQRYWGGAENIDLAFVGMELGEEAGEALGALKKLIRHDKGVAGNSTADREVLVYKLMSELGDVMINTSRLCNYLDLDPSQCIRQAFNDKSDKLGIDLRI